MYLLPKMRIFAGESLVDEFWQRTIILQVYLNENVLKTVCNYIVRILKSFKTYYFYPGGGGGYSDLVPTGVCRWSRQTRTHFKGNFGGKGYPLLGVFIQENHVFVYFSDEMGENI